MGQQGVLKLVQSFRVLYRIVTFPITQMDQHSFNSTFPGNGDDSALDPFQKNIIKYYFLILYVFASLPSGSNPSMLNLSMDLDFFEPIFRCARLDAISLNEIHEDTNSGH
jgi:hypothetical protein